MNDEEMEKFEFTEIEKVLVNNAKKKMLDENATFSLDELNAVVKFERHEATRNDDWKARNELRREREQAIIEECRKTEDVARKNLNDLTQAALDRLERLENVKQEQA